MPPLPPLAESPAEQLWPGQRLRRGGVTWLIEQVAVNSDGVVTVTARPPEVAAPRTIRLVAGELVRVLVR